MKKILTEEEKKAKKLKRKGRKEANEKLEDFIVDHNKQVFIDRTGRPIELLSFLREDEFWTLDRKRIEEGKRIIQKRRVITYSGIKRLAKEAGIYLFTKEKVFDPTIENHNLVGFDVTIYCESRNETITPKEGFCSHGFGKTIVLGEASDLNTKSIGMKYKATMAEKRGYSRAVITHLSLVDILGEDELEEANEESQKLNDTMTDEEKEQLAPLFNKILNVKDLADLDALGEEIKSEAGEYSKSQLEHLRKVYKNKRSELEKTKF